MSEEHRSGSRDASQRIGSDDDRHAAVLDGDYEVPGKTDQDEPELGAGIAGVEDRDPVVACRYCRDTFARVVDIEDHHYTCDAFEDYRREQAADETDHLKRTYFIDPAPHEFKAYAKYDVGLEPYFGLVSLYKEHDFEDHGALKTAFEADGWDHEWEVAFSFKSCGLAPRDHPGFTLEEVHEFVIKLHPAGIDHDDALQAITFTVSPRWPDLKSTGDSPNPSNPHDILGIDVEYNGSNIPFDDYPELFHRAMAALADRQGFRFNSPTTIPADDVQPDRMHHSSNVVDAELYVRVREGLTGEVYAFDGTLHRLFQLLGQDRDGYAKTIRDDRECEGYYHTAMIDQDRANEFLAGHSLGKEFKHYHVDDPDSVAGDDMLEHPKIGVSFQNSCTDRTLYWEDLDRLEKELDEALLNVLRQSDIPLRPDRGVYVEDHIFDVTGSSRFRTLLGPDALPRIQAQQDQEVIATVSNMYETDVLVTEELLTDGGNLSPSDLSERLGRHIDTIYRSLDRLGDVVEHTYGEVALQSQHIGQQLVRYIEGAKDGVQNTLTEAIDDLVTAGRVAEGDSAFDRWRNTYGVRFEEIDADGAADAELTMEYQPTDERDVREILRSGALYWSQLVDAPRREFFRRFKPRIELADGSRPPYQDLDRLFKAAAGPV